MTLAVDEMLNMHGSRGGNRVTPLKNIGSLSSTGPDSLKNQARSFQWYFAGAQLWLTFSVILILSPLIKLKKIIVRVGPPLAKLFGSAHVKLTHLLNLNFVVLNIFMCYTVAVIPYFYPVNPLPHNNAFWPL